ncbi:hypothetical protein [Rhodococcus zopfii]|uniref:hypothetical protein n=1 Tax=Rhodococcus zopfii TaxID=43772 RepID=UPI00157D99B5|nr:hypothetical protein [Rhodococcus zopfii]
MDRLPELRVVDLEDGIDIWRQGIARAVPVGWTGIRREHSAALDDEHIRVDLAGQASSIGEVRGLDLVHVRSFR